MTRSRGETVHVESEDSPGTIADSWATRCSDSRTTRLVSPLATRSSHNGRVSSSTVGESPGSNTPVLVNSINGNPPPLPVTSLVADCPGKTAPSSVRAIAARAVSSCEPPSVSTTPPVASGPTVIDIDASLGASGVGSGSHAVGKKAATDYEDHSHCCPASSDRQHGRRRATTPTPHSNCEKGTGECRSPSSCGSWIVRRRRCPLRPPAGRSGGRDR